MLKFIAQFKFQLAAIVCLLIALHVQGEINMEKCHALGNSDCQILTNESL